MWNSHPGHTPRISGSFCLCLKQGARTISAERSRALGQFSWIQPGILYKENRINKGLHTQKRQLKEKSCLIWVLHSRLQFLLHFSVLILGHSCFTFPQFVHFLPWALKIRFWGCRRNLWTKMQEMHYFRFLKKKKINLQAQGQTPACNWSLYLFTWVMSAGIQLTISPA